MKLKTLALAVGLASFGVVTASQAGIILPPGIAIMEDDNIEYAMTIVGEDTAGTPIYGLKTSGTLEVGDRLHAVITFDKIMDESSNIIQDLGAPGQELTGISVLEVKAITTGGDFVFGPSAAFEAVYGAGALAALFQETPGDLLTSCNSSGIAACENAAADGTPWMTVGFGDSDDFWYAASALPADFADVTIQTIAGLNATTKVGVANYALSILANNTGYTFEEKACPLCALFPDAGDDGFTDITGSGDILGGSGLTSPWFARSDFDFEVDRVPEPGSLALLGLGLAGLGFGARRRKA